MGVLSHCTHQCYTDSHTATACSTTLTPVIDGVSAFHSCRMLVSHSTRQTGTAIPECHSQWAQQQPSAPVCLPTVWCQVRPLCWGGCRTHMLNSKQTLAMCELPRTKGHAKLVDLKGLQVPHITSDTKMTPTTSTTGLNPAGSPCCLPPPATHPGATDEHRGCAPVHTVR